MPTDEGMKLIVEGYNLRENAIQERSWIGKRIDLIEIIEGEVEDIEHLVKDVYYNVKDKMELPDSRFDYISRGIETKIKLNTSRDQPSVEFGFYGGWIQINKGSKIRAYIDLGNEELYIEYEGENSQLPIFRKMSLDEKEAVENGLYARQIELIDCNGQILSTYRFTSFNKDDDKKVRIFDIPE